jgi:hypothetical protein
MSPGSPGNLPNVRVDFANLNAVALKRLKTATEMSEQLRKTQETASKFEQAFEVIHISELVFFKTKTRTRHSTGSKIPT